jgi:hypothetical protein
MKSICFSCFHGNLQATAGFLSTAAALPLLHLPKDAACLKVVIFAPFCCGFVIPSWNNALRGIH